MTRIKICGVTRRADAEAVALTGADALGLIFHRPSPRYVKPEQAREIAAQLSPFVTVVGVFVDPDADTLQRIIDSVPLDLIQLHGDEPPAFCQQLERPYVKAVRMHEAADVRSESERFSGARALLVDAYVADVPGGTGRSFAWERLPKITTKPIILAGGLTPNNVGEAIQQVRPYAVDVSSGVEQRPGIKDLDKIKRFVAAVREADAQRDIGDT